jgi:hypothetical protein
MPLTLRLIKGSELTYAELDGNFTFITGSYTPLAATSSMSVATASYALNAVSASHALRSNVADKLRTVNVGGAGTFYPLIASNYTGDVDVYTIQAPDYKYNLSINQLVVSSVSASFTGSLSGTAATASNITPAIASDGVNRVLTSDGDGTVTAEANLTFNGSTLLVTGSVTVSGSNTLTNIGPARFRGDTANSTTVTAVEITGSSRMSGSLVISGSLQVGVGNAPAIDTTVGTLSRGGATSVDWLQRFLIDSSAATAVNWESKALNDSADVSSVDWEGRLLYDPDGIEAASWDGRRLFDSNGVRVFDWEMKRLHYSNSNTLLDFSYDGSAYFYVSGGLSISASGAPSATASLGINYNPASDDWYTINLRTQKSGVSSSIDISKYITVSHGAGGATQLLGRTEFYPTSEGIRIFESPGLFNVGLATSIASTLTVAGVTRLANNTLVTGSLLVTGSATIENILTLTPRTTTPTGVASGSIIVSGSATGIKPYFWNGSVWTAMF